MNKSPECRDCNNPATTRCHECGGFFCPVHVSPLRVAYGQSGGNRELLCGRCFESSVKKMWAFYVGALLFVTFMLFSFSFFENAENERDGTGPAIRVEFVDGKIQHVLANPKSD